MSTAPFRWLSTERLRDSDAAKRDEAALNPRQIHEEANSDRGRIVFCAAFRRLHLKTQVFALEQDAAVRTRLTHSLEVAHIGTYIVDTLFKALESRSDPDTDGIEEWKKVTPNQRSAIRTFVEAACLVHDIGNPPFGHFGEKAICNWFKKKESMWKDTVSSVTESKYDDFAGFDGNKQGFRTLTRLQRNMDDDVGLNLTLTQLASTIKYPISTGQNRQKGSVFESERHLKERIWSGLGLEVHQRHPLSLLMESADDIAYCVSDIEDAVDKELITDVELKEAFGEHWPTIPGKNREAHLTLAKTYTTTFFVKEAAKQFISRIQKDGNVRDTSKPLLNDAVGVLGSLKALASKRIYSSRVILANEITGFAVIEGLLHAFEPILKMKNTDLRQLAVQVRDKTSIYEDDTRPMVKRLTAEPGLLALLPKKHLATYIGQASGGEDEMFHRIHLIVDFISGMTDQFALDSYRLLIGQRTHA